ncbi:MAG: HEAT repeat domain-containing protein [Blastocatellia bacterium]|nr:HEAT repeat domain-containing protein [Blastocatellia bacterium]
MKLVRLVCLCLFLTATVCGATQAPKSWAEQFVAAQTLERNGKPVEALQAYVAIPGAEHLAVRLLREQRETLLPVVEKLAAAPTARRNPRWLLVQGEAWLVNGKREEALACYRNFVKCLGRTGQDGWENGSVPPDFYPVELPPARNESTPRCNQCLEKEVLTPFRCGPGSYRDNLLLRRFLELGAWNDATQEFSRIWKLHQEYVGSGQFPGQALQFALDYAYFLKEQKHPAQELAVLLQPVAHLDVDHHPVWQYLRQAEALATTGPRRTHTAQPPFPLISDCGVTQTEYVRLAFQEFAEQGQLPVLHRLLQTEIRQGRNAARLTLARVLLLAGKRDEAIQTERSYLENLHLFGLTHMYRTARMYEFYQDWAATAAEYEKLLQLPEGIVLVPDMDDLTREMFPGLEYNASGQAAFHRLAHQKILSRLETLYPRANDFKKAFACTLKLLELNPPGSRFGNRDVDKLCQTALETGQVAELTRLIEAELDQTMYADYKIKLAEALDDREKLSELYLEASATRFRNQQSWVLPDTWRTHMLHGGTTAYRAFLKKLADFYPQNMFLQLELLFCEGKLESEAGTQCLETLLGQRAVRFDYRRGNNLEGYCYESYEDVAQALLKQYGQSGRTDKTLALALHIVRNEPPFELSPEKVTQLRQHPDYGRFPRLEETLRLAISQLSITDLQILAEAAKGKPIEQLGLQVMKALPLKLAAQPLRKLPGWANLPPGVQAVSGMENVLSLCRDENRVYTGHPWGIAIFDFQGNFINRVALGTPATQLIALNGALWIGSSTGLIRMDCKTFALSRLSLQQSILKQEIEYYQATVARLYPNPSQTAENLLSLFNQVWALAPQGDALWITTRFSILRYNTRTTDLRIFHLDEIDPRPLGNWDHIWVDGEYVWVDSYSSSSNGLVRYDLHSDRWTKPFGETRLSLIGELGGKFWAYIADAQWNKRLGLLDSRAGTVTPVPVENPGPFEPRGWHYLGMDRDKLLFGTQSGNFFYDKTNGKLRPWATPQTQAQIYFPCTSEHSSVSLLPNGAFALSTASECKDEAEVFYNSLVQVLLLPDGTKVWAPYEPMIYLRQAEWLPIPYEYPFRGLAFQFPDGTFRPITFPAGTGNLTGDAVYGLIGSEKTEDGFWLGTNNGLSRLNNRLELEQNLTRTEGLPSNLVLGVWWKNGRLNLLHELESKQVSRLDPQAGLLEPVPQPDAALKRDVSQFLSGFSLRVFPKESLPYLGGLVVGRQSRAGKTLVWGTHGLLVLDDAKTIPTLKIDDLPVSVSPNQNAMLRIAAETAAVPSVPTLEQFRRLLQSDNPYLVARVLATAEKNPNFAEADLFPFLVTFSSHPHERVRGTVLHLLCSLKGEAALPLIQKMRADPQPGISALAVIETAKRGGTLEPARFEAFWQQSGLNLPVGLNQREYIPRDMMFEALLSHPTADAIRLFVTHPFRPATPKETKILQELGAILTKYPPFLLTFLEAPRPQETINSPDWDNFLSEVFKSLGTEAEPTLREALRSSKPQVRWQALQACQVVAHPALVPELTALLRLPDGPQYDAAEALAASKTPEAIAALVELYRVERNGTRWSNRTMDAPYQSGGYQQWGRFSAVSEGWPGGPKPESPPMRVLGLASLIFMFDKLDPALTSEFYRELATDALFANRIIAARRLAQSPPAEWKTNRTVLRKLLDSPSEELIASATVSLLLLDDPQGAMLIKQYLTGDNLTRKRLTIEELARVSDKSRLEFAREALTRCAADPLLQKEHQERARQLLSAK